MMKRIICLLAFLSVAIAQSSGVGQIWTVVSGTLQSAATANGNGTALSIRGLSSSALTVNCSVACSGGTTINFEGSEDGTNYVALTAVQIGTATIATTILNQGTTITVWQTPIGGLQSIRARISGYSAGTVTVTATASAAPWDPKTINANQFIGGTAVSSSTVLGHVVADTGSTTAVTQATASNLNAVVQPGNTANTTPWLVAPGTEATTANSGLTSYLTSAASTNSTSVKGSAGNVYGISLINTTTTNYFLRMYNSSSAPTCSSATGFIETIPALGAAANGGGISRPWTVAQGYTTGIGFCLTGGGSSTDNTNAATGVYVTILYK